MSNKIQQTILAGVAGTSAMSVIMYVGSILGLPKMNPPKMLSLMIGFPMLIAWLMHFLIGITFAFMYAYFIVRVVKKINSKILKGVIFGVFAFIFGQIMIALLAAIFGDIPAGEDNMMLLMIGSIIGHLVFGIVVVQFIKDPVAEKSFA